VLTSVFFLGTVFVKACIPKNALKTATFQQQVRVLVVTCSFSVPNHAVVVEDVWLALAMTVNVSSIANAEITIGFLPVRYLGCSIVVSLILQH